MSSPETASVKRSSLAQDWLNALRYWLGGRRAVIGVVVLVVGAGLALNWSWLVAIGAAPLLLALAPCAVMCGLGLCMNKMAGGSCSASASTTDYADASTQNATGRITAAEPVKQASVSPVSGGRPPDEATAGTAEPAPNEKPRIPQRRE